MSQKITPSVLCSACHDMFNGNSPPCYRAHINSSGYGLHHTSPAQFRDAALRKCYICVRNWARVPHSYQIQWSEGKGMFSSDSSDFMRYRFIANENGHFGPTGLSSAVDMPWVEFLWNNMDPLRSWRALFLLVPTTALIESVEEGRLRASFSCNLYPNGTFILDHDWSTSSLRTLQLAKEWCVTCDANHEICNKRKSNQIPTRLLDIGSPGSTQWRLCFTAEEFHEAVKFIALSYRWGSQSQTLTLGESTLDTFRNGLLISELPQTFKDAITVAHFLEIRYLWMDSLCIFQDSLQDWEHESQMMSAVYSNAFCVLAAAASKEPNDSLFRARDAEDILPGLVSVDTQQGEIPICGSFLLVEHKSWQRECQASVLQWRGWCVQERILAARVLHFAERQLLWECDTSVRSECLVDNFPALPLANKKSNLRIAAISQVEHSDSELDTSRIAYKNWITIVEGYSKCLLTKGNDKLVAISGLASFFETKTKDSYLAGVWKSNLLAYLVWMIDIAPGLMTVWELFTRGFYDRLRRPQLQVHPTEHHPGLGPASIEVFDSKLRTQNMPTI